MNEKKQSKINWRFKAADGTELFAHTFPAKNPPKAIVCLVHGHGEHIERYANLAAALNKADYTLVGFDLRGHGQSAGKRGHTPSYETLLGDIDAFLAEADEYHPAEPHFLYGHSLGGNLVLNYALRRKPKLRGVISTSPWLKLAFEPSAIQISLAKIMDKLFPAFIQHSGLKTSDLSHDKAVVRAYEEDPLVHDNISARLFIAMHESGLWALDHAEKFPLPLLLMHGSADRITSADASREFAEKAGEQVTFKLWEGFYHETHNEPEKDAVFQTIISWLDTH
jgi:alpha-beta hydrolase superfamily lysophospholipase